METAFDKLGLETVDLDELGLSCPITKESEESSDHYAITRVQLDSSDLELVVIEATNTSGKNVHVKVSMLVILNSQDTSLVNAARNRKNDSDLIDFITANYYVARASQGTRISKYYLISNINRKDVTLVIKEDF